MIMQKKINGNSILVIANSEISGACEFPLLQRKKKLSIPSVEPITALHFLRYFGIDSLGRLMHSAYTGLSKGSVVWGI